MQRERNLRFEYRDIRILFVFVPAIAMQRIVERNNRTTQNKTDSIFIDLQCLFL